MDVLLTPARIRLPRPRRRPQRLGPLCQQLQLPQRLADPEREQVAQALSLEAMLTRAVCVSDALVAEIKRIVKESDILKYGGPLASCWAACS